MPAHAFCGAGDYSGAGRAASVLFGLTLLVGWDMGEGLHKQAKTLTDRQIKRVLAEVATPVLSHRNGRYCLNSRYDAALQRMTRTANLQTHAVQRTSAPA